MREKTEERMESKGLFGRKYLDLTVRTREIAPPDEDHVIVKVRACGVCGTDVNFVRDWEDEAMPLGHEIAGDVVEVGKNVRNVAPGDRVIVEDCSLCGICEDCKSGHPELCRNLYNLEGQPGMGEYLSVRYNSLDRFDGLDYVTACLTEPLAVALTAVLNAEIPTGGSVVVLGNGPLGLMAACLARRQGASFVAVTGLPASDPLSKARLSAALRLGCNQVVEVGKQDLEEEIKRRFPAGVDRVIVSSPPESLPDAFKVIRFGGIITFFGLHFGGKSTVPIDINDLVFRKISLRPTFAEPAINFPLALRLLREGQIEAKSMVTHTFRMEEAKSIFQAIVEGSKPIIKAVLVPHG